MQIVSYACVVILLNRTKKHNPTRSTRLAYTCKTVVESSKRTVCLIDKIPGNKSRWLWSHEHVHKHFKRTEIKAVDRGRMTKVGGGWEKCQTRTNKENNDSVPNNRYWKTRQARLAKISASKPRRDLPQVQGSHASWKWEFRSSYMLQCANQHGTRGKARCTLSHVWTRYDSKVCVNDAVPKETASKAY